MLTRLSNACDGHMVTCLDFIGFATEEFLEKNEHGPPRIGRSFLLETSRDFPVTFDCQRLDREKREVKIHLSDTLMCTRVSGALTHSQPYFCSGFDEEQTSGLIVTSGAMFQCFKTARPLLWLWSWESVKGRCWTSQEVKTSWGAGGQPWRNSDFTAADAGADGGSHAMSFKTRWDGCRIRWLWISLQKAEVKVASRQHLHLLNPCVEAPSSSVNTQNFIIPGKPKNKLCHAQFVWRDPDLKQHMTWGLRS